MKKKDRADAASELGKLLKSLSHKPVVSVRHGRLRDVRFGDVRFGDGSDHELSALAAQVHALVAEVHPLWADLVPTGATPPTAAEIEALLEPIAADAAAEALTALAADDLVWPGHAHMPRDLAHERATRVVSWLGPEASWWTNRHRHGWSPVTACTFDGVVAGSNGEHFAVLLQIGED